jgi:hypothetical protein
MIEINQIRKWRTVGDYEHIGKYFVIVDKRQSYLDAFYYVIRYLDSGGNDYLNESFIEDESDECDVDS